MRLRGFTLVEVLVALAIVAAGTAALLTALNSAARNTVFLREKALASWVASNRIAETRLLTAPAPAGTTTGETEMGGQRWQWQQTVSSSQLPGMLRVDVKVRMLGPAGAARSAATRSPNAAGPGASEDGDWTFEAAAVIGLQVALPTGTDPDWNPPAPDNAGSGGTPPDPGNRT